MASKKIVIKRARPFIHESINSEAMQQQLAYTRRGIGSYFASKNSTRSGSGLTVEEESLLLPLILGIPVNDMEFRKKVDLYYTNINTLVPFGAAGLELEVGQEKEWINPLTINDKGLPKRSSEGSLVIKACVTADNMPINVDDYIKYRHGIKHPDTGATPQEAEGNKLMQYYVEDPDAVNKGKVDQLAIDDQALVDYAQIKLDKDKTKMIVTVMRTYIKAVSGKPKLDPERATPEELAIALKELALSQPERFHQFATDANIKKRYFIDSLLSAGILNRVGNNFLDAESNVSLGTSVQEVALKLYDGKNTAQFNLYKQRLEDKKGNRVVLTE
jgi:hypothetical protein